MSRRRSLSIGADNRDLMPCDRQGICQRLHTQGKNAVIVTHQKIHSSGENL